MSWRRGIAWAVTGLALLGAAGCAGDRRPSSDRPGPNVLLIVVDTLRRDHLGLYGYERSTTPTIDAFFAGGTLFEHATSSAPCTVPAVKQLLTGARDFDDRRARLAEILGRAGYQTAAVVSQNHFREPAGALPEYSRGFDSFDVQSQAEVDHHGMSTRSATEVSDRALAWLAARSRERPFFLWLHYFDPHDPYEPPPSYRVFGAPDPAFGGDRRTYLKEALLAALARANDVEKERILSRPNSHAHFGEIFSPAQAATLVSYYDGEILYTDDQIGRVLRALEEEGSVDDTLVILTSDHGERLGENNRWAHCQSVHGYEIDVPLLLSARVGDAPRVAPAVSILDVAPTVLETAGIDLEDFLFDGRSLFEVEVPEEPWVYTVWQGEEAIQDGAWKLTIREDERQQILNRIEVDPAESRNLAQRERGRLRLMRRALIDSRSRTDDVQRRISETLEQLRAIGYVQ